MAPKRNSSGSAPASQRSISSFFAAKPAAGKGGKENTSAAGKAPVAAGARRSPAVTSRGAATGEAKTGDGGSAPVAARQTRSASASPAVMAKQKPAVKACSPRSGSAQRPAVKAAGAKRSPAGVASTGAGVVAAAAASVLAVGAGSAPLIEDPEGRRVRVWWPSEREWYEGTVGGRTGRKHSVQYDDGDVELVDLSKEKFELLEDGKFRLRRRC